MSQYSITRSRSRVGLSQRLNSITCHLQITHPCRRQPAIQDIQGALRLHYQVPSESPTVSPATTLCYSPTTVAVERFANAVWYRSKAKIKGALAPRDSNTPRNPRQSRGFPPEIVEMIIAHLTYDTVTLKACVATCFTWYNVATPHLHHTLILRRWSPHSTHQYLISLASLHKLGLLSFVKRVRFEMHLGFLWAIPNMIDSRSIRYFGALVNLQDLAIADLDFSMFPMAVGEYFGHFSPTLRSVALLSPLGTRRQILDFLTLFPNLDDIKISYYHALAQERETLDTQLIPIKGGLRGRLVLRDFSEEGLLKDIIAAFGGMRFISMDLCGVRGMRPLLEACADTLETVRIRPDSSTERCKRVPYYFFYFFSTPGLTSFFQYSPKISTSRATPPFDLWSSKVSPYVGRGHTLARSKNFFPPSRLQHSPRSLSYSPVWKHLGHHQSWLRRYAGCTEPRSLGWHFA